MLGDANQMPSFGIFWLLIVEIIEGWSAKFGNHETLIIGSAAVWVSMDTRRLCSHPRQKG